MVTNGTSTANKSLSMQPGRQAAPFSLTVLHKLLTHPTTMSVFTPGIYFRPTRNAYGILGGIPQSEFQHATIAKRVKKHQTNLAGTCCNYQLYL